MRGTLNPDFSLNLRELVNLHLKVNLMGLLIQDGSNISRGKFKWNVIKFNQNARGSPHFQRMLTLDTISSDWLISIKFYQAFNQIWRGCQHLQRLPRPENGCKTDISLNHQSTLQWSIVQWSILQWSIVQWSIVHYQ